MFILAESTIDLPNWLTQLGFPALAAGWLWVEIKAMRKRQDDKYDMMEKRYTELQERIDTRLETVIKDNTLAIRQFTEQCEDCFKHFQRNPS